MSSLFIYGVVEHTRPWLQGVQTTVSSELTSTKKAPHTAGGGKQINHQLQQLPGR